MDINGIKQYLKEYDGPEMNIMEVCGSHTAAIAKTGIESIISRRIHLISGPGCPVCVTPSSYVDRLIDLACTEGTEVVTFGDLIRVPGSKESLGSAKGRGAKVHMVYSPNDTVSLAREHPEAQFVFAAVGFETTTPAYALLVDQIVKEKIPNIRLLTALKTMPEVIDSLCASGAPIQGFIAPGHVSVITGYRVYQPLADRYQIPFGVAGFRGMELLIALYGIVRSYGKGKVMNFYPSVVTEEGNLAARELVNRYFEPCSAVWRGIGEIEGSGRILRSEYDAFDAGSRDLTEDRKANEACCCDRVLTGRMRPGECPLFGRVCTPLKPQGACMVSTEGSCYSYFMNKRK